MRTFKFIGMAFIALMMCVNFSACNKDDDDPSYEDLIIGTWSDGDFTYTFKTNGTGTEKGKDKGKEYSDSFEWSISGDKITLYFEDDEDSEFYTIEKLTEDELIWSMKDGDKTYKETYSKK